MVEANISLEQFMAEPPEPQRHGGCGSCGTGKAGGSQCGNGLEKIYPTTAVRFGFMRYIGEFTHAPDMKFTCGARVVIQTRRGIELGEQVSLTCNGCDKSVTRDQMKEWVSSCGEDSYIFDAGRILREATAADLAEYARIQNSAREKRRFCREVAGRYKLSLRVVDCETPFGGERIIFYFTASERIDFRPIVKDLTLEYRTRIEMRQVGARDEARLLADYETCGREVCCKVFLKTLRPISMRMAKLQKATLDPTQVSGRCGRLKCCLRYEHIGYEELNKQLPRVGIRIRTNHGEGVIVNRQVLTQLVQIRTDSNTLLTVVAEDITEVGVEAPPSPPVDAAAPPPRVPRPRAGPRALDAPRIPLRSLAEQPTSPPQTVAHSDETGPAIGTGSNSAAHTGTKRPGDVGTPGGSRRRRGRRRRGRGRGQGPGGPGAHGSQPPPNNPQS